MDGQDSFVAVLFFMGIFFLIAYAHSQGIY